MRLHLFEDEARQILAVHQQDIFDVSFVGKVRTHTRDHLAGELEQ
jgi:hypothetical protein